jgi:hypothetical protein
VKISRVLNAGLFLALAQSALCKSPTLLEQLAKQLQQARQLPVGYATYYRCPEDVDSLIGIAKQSIKSSLGKPDYIGNEEDWSYFFTSPRPPEQLGGGFPQFTFYFDKSDKSARVTCHRAK